MIRRPPRSTQSRSSAASDVYKRQGEEATWSRREQSGVRRSDRTAAELVDGNRAYEDRFGRVFLICASGKNAEEILEALRARLHNDPESEAAVVVDELRQIALLRLRNVVDQSITDPVRSTPVRSTQ